MCAVGGVILNNLRKLREEKHLSQQKLADKFSLTQQSIYKYEHELAEPDIQTLISLADFFNTSVDYLIGHNDDRCIIDEKISKDEAQLLSLYRQLPASLKRRINELIQEIIESK